eukprot:1216077-Pyramimonas_sp.AAC.1
MGIVSGRAGGDTFWSQPQAKAQAASKVDPGYGRRLITQRAHSRLPRLPPREAKWASGDIFLVGGSHATV